MERDRIPRPRNSDRLERKRVESRWINLGKKADPSKLPRIFCVNWFRKTTDGKWLWPGFGENSRVLKWVFERCAGTIDAEETAIGFMPKTVI